ncbi:MAG: type II secretion system F family protein [Anaerolineales bacterium]|nr:type II secretion system F family protein [Anaerolineales bacterium]
MLTGIIVIVVLVIIGATILIIAGLRRPKEEEDPLAARLAEFSERGEVVSLEDIELAQPFSERVILPLARSVGDLSARFTPQHQVESTAISLELAGNPGRIDASSFLALRLVVAGLFGGLLFLIFLFSSNWPVSRELITTLIFTILGFFFPQLWLKSKIDRRQKEIRKALPDALDLLTICVEAGLGFDAAMAKVNEKWDNELALALGRAIREIQLGKLRREALRDMSERIGIPEMTSFVAAVIQSEQLGVSMARVLRIQSDQMRVKRRQRAEEEARKAPIKMIFPLGIFIFPSIMIVLLTPAGLRLRDAFAPLMAR